MSSDAQPGHKALWTLFFAAFGVRLAAALALGGFSIKAGTSAWDWGHEPACIAQALLEGRGYSDPWGQGTGATAWLTPPFPLLLAVAMKLGGGVTATSMAIVVTLQALASALTAVLLVKLARTLGCPRAGRLAGWLFAFYPIAISNTFQLVWDTTFVALALTWVLERVLRPGTSVVGNGLAYGALLVLNPAPASLAPLLLGFTWRRSGLKAAATFALAAGALCAPWMLRNQLALGAFSLRPNLGVELRIGNHDEADGRPVPFKYHPSHVPEELALYRELGEVQYSAENRERAVAWIRANPGRFVSLSARRSTLFWVSEPPSSDTRQTSGKSAARDPASWVKYASYVLAAVGALVALAKARLERDVRILLVLSLLAFGAPYYLTHVSERYRFPVDPLLVALGAVAVQHFRERRNVVR
ncbi:MAG: hypothetical protein HUU28_08405 [Planctomycetaceae bacterium]|nr:hypothetical protein [Planctomycetaceae bacterium]